MATVFTVRRGRPGAKVFDATRIIERVGGEATGGETPARRAAPPGTLLLRR
jgi:hypothetical protein